ncbi:MULTISPECIES: 50S ribosomal protein L24 [Mucilaginibacter]|uniref:50S ribosomal protein L24 n=1 Tax=Mucilaginibacter TaxID=423349 RepID=UPI0020917D4E|nr:MULTISPECIES: 50S ribosomal protein L24 [Mucilaginibacter]MCO5935853.1 50S ribosomal protein L24 [Mucilaginibacter aurantiaciroseus]MEB0263562.1 50S ribosomal protein L24 [Mucilaginibacter sp. 10I4]MEB0277713.1 50S ribosomal protein L24 [Mucilaginibacter sp. 10B2]MEB0303053.1 50S ribosomal protein L24 [Mucilaginibacter sp. 5C4]WPX24662.1 50S ribosomal protein L24 [Mucilaginibacter sp. 5C4]
MEKKNTKPAKLKIRKGDLVKVIAGDSKGSQGKIVEVIIEKNRAIVEGANMVSKHTKPNAANPNGGIVKQEAAIHISNLALVEPSTGKTTRVGRKLNDAGKLVRVSKKSGEEIK